MEELKYPGIIDTMLIGACLMPILYLGPDCVVNTMHNIVPDPQLFSDEFWTSHESSYGTNFSPEYLRILRRLFDLINCLENLRRDTEVAFHDLNSLFVTNLLDAFLRELQNSLCEHLTLRQGFENVTELENYSERMSLFYQHVIDFHEAYTVYGNAYQEYLATLQQVQSINPRFILPDIVHLRPLLLSPGQAFLLAYIYPDLYLSPGLITQNMTNRDPCRTC